ncbi:alcohol dehydrogenase catalytic domain-containing protein [Streptomyces sp. B6B3]|uniref:zinc-dependent alcohol dehydrogenase n=1 Tax=Streptomyces sp. B6B3 TaxID=3153570 RepID=UPI00325C794D
MLRGVGRIGVEEVAEPVPGPGEALVEMRAVGLCGSDLAAFHGRHPFRSAPVVLGHEGAGRVARAAAGGRYGDGRRVAIMPLLSCWECPRCESGLAHLCAHRRVPGAGWEGMLGGYVPVPERALFPLAERLSWGEGALIEPAAVAFHTARTASVGPGQRVAVLGAGPIGALVAAVCRQQHHIADLVVSDLREQRLAVARGMAGCHTIDAGREEVVAAGLARCGADGADGFDVVVVASGHPSCLDEALALCRPRGTVVLLPMFGAPVAADLNPVVLREIVVRGATVYTPDDFRAAAAAVNDGTLDVRPLLDGEPLPLAETQAAFEDLARGAGSMKILVDPAQ